MPREGLGKELLGQPGYKAKIISLHGELKRHNG